MELNPEDLSDLRKAFYLISRPLASLARLTQTTADI